MAAATALFLLLLATPAVFATDYTVGDSAGWDTGVDYTAWASGKIFNVGDNLVFTYTSNHKVDEVTPSAYASCSSSNSIQSYSGGSTTFPLTKPGPYYFLCPTLGHCGQGMKLSVIVAAGATPTPTPATPTTPSTPSGTPSPPSSSGTPPAKSGASSRFQELSGLALGASLMWGALVALMG